MLIRKSLLLLACAALGLSFSAPTLAQLSLNFPLQTSGGTDSDGSASSGSNLGTGSFAAVYYGPELPPSTLFTLSTSDGKPHVTINCKQVDGTTACVSPVDTLDSTGSAFTFSHVNSPKVPDSVTCIPDTAGDNCFDEFEAQQTIPTGGEIPAKIQIHGSSVFDGIYTIASISADGNTITIVEKFPTKSQGDVTEPNADYTTTPTVASISVFIHVEGDVYLRKFEGTSSDPGDEQPTNMTLSGQPPRCDPGDSGYDPNNLPLPGQCSQDATGSLDYETAGVVDCATGPDGARTYPCQFSADIHSGQTGRVSIAAGDNNINNCHDGSVFGDCTYFIGDYNAKNINKHVIDLYYDATANFSREQVFSVTASALLGFSAVLERGCGSGFLVGDLTTYSGTFDCGLSVDQDSLPIYQVGVATNPTSINGSSTTSTYDLDVIPPLEVQATTVVPHSLTLQYQGTVESEERTATVATVGDPSCNNTTAACLHVKFSRLGTLCAVAYVTGGTLTPGQEFSLPLRGQIDNPESPAAVDGLLRHDDADPKMTYGGSTDFVFDPDLCRDTGLLVDYDPPLPPPPQP